MNNQRAFSLVELAVVLVILGLMIGSVVSGKSLIRAAQINATLAQVETIKVAARSFQEKYFHYPGDIPTADAINLGLTRYNTFAGNGDGKFAFRAGGESQLFYVHLSQKGFLAGGFELFDVNADVSGSDISRYIMAAKLPTNFYFNIWSGGPDPTHPTFNNEGTNGINYIGLSSTNRYCDYNICGVWGGNATMATFDAYTFDMKIDDGKPQSGEVQAFYVKSGLLAQWAGGEFHSSGTHVFNSPLPSTAANPAGSLNCYDNGGVGGVAQSYTISMENNTCAISFKL